MITKYGYDVFFTITGICIALILVALVLIEPKSIKYSIIAVAFVFFGFTLNFLRAPERVSASGDHVIISPADGKIISLKKVTENEFFKGEALQISIFMSPE